MMSFLEVIGTIAFALSGIRLAAEKSFDLLGLYCIGLATAIGGGTIRDILLGTQPFWFTEIWVLWAVFLSLVGFGICQDLINKIAGTIFLFDTIGLGIFTEIGVTKGLEYGCPFIIAVIIGAITGAGGGVIRDICINDIPLVFRKEIYALACVFGGFVYYALDVFGCSEHVYKIGCVISVISVRLLAAKYHWQLPCLNMKH